MLYAPSRPLAFLEPGKPPYDSLVALLKSDGASVEFLGDGDTPVAHAVRQKDIRALQRLTSEGANPNKRTRTGTLPLQLALAQCSGVPDQVQRPGVVLDQFGHVDEYRQGELIEKWKGADARAQEENRGVASLVNELLEAKADPNLPVKEAGGNVDTLLSIATERCSSDIPKALVKYGARVDSIAMKAAVFSVKDLFLEKTHSPER
jgi:ankyrin repeat protein